MAETIFKVTGYILTIALGGVALWFKQSANLKGWAAEQILYAEMEYGDLTNAGGKKFKQVTDWLCDLIPAVIRPFVPRAFVERLIQSTFDAMEDYAKIQIDPDGYFFPTVENYEMETEPWTLENGEPLFVPSPFEAMCQEYREAQKHD